MGPCPLSTTSLSLYIAYLFDKKLSPKTISTYLSAMAYLHKIKGHPDPTKNFVIQKIMAGAYRLRPTFDIRLPITAPVLDKLLRATQATFSRYDQTLFQAMYTFAFHTYARIGELTIPSRSSPSNAAIQLKDIVIITKSKIPQEVKVCFRIFKHNLTCQPHWIAFKATHYWSCPVQLLMRYLKIRGATQGNLFLGVDTLPVTRAHFDQQLRICLNFCQLDTSRYKGHSFRIGAASWDAQNGVPDSQIRLKGRWRSDAFRKYIRVLTN